MKSIVPMKWLLARMNEPDVVIVDCRFHLAEPNLGRRQYEESRIPGAVYFDLEKDLSRPVTEHGGRHPLPDLDRLAGKLGQAGLERSSRVVAYDDQGGAMASRFWWLLKYMGHEQIFVLEEGFTAWQHAGYPITSAQPPIRVPVNYSYEIQTQMLADMNEVREASASGAAQLIDSRAPRRYAGLDEPIDGKAGHIPGAANRFWKDNLLEHGKWKPTEQLRRECSVLANGKPIIVYCGSGVTACPNVLALSDADMANVKLYAGSWSDWISYSENPIATGEK